MKRAKGFTIVELMIVVGILGVIASIALPIYRDFISRGKVSEAVTLLGGLKTPMTEYYGNSGVWPMVATVSGKTRGNYVELLESGGSEADGMFYVQATMNADEARIGGMQLRNLYYPDTDNWVCTTAGTDNPLPPQYLPAPCR